MIIIWRVYAFYPGRKERWILAIPVALLISSIGELNHPLARAVNSPYMTVVTSCLISFCVAELVKDPSIGDFDNPPFCKHVQLSMYCTTLATTGVATFLICYKTWSVILHRSSIFDPELVLHRYYRRTIGRHLRSSSTKTRGEKIMIILVESGILYFLFFVSSMIVFYIR